MSIENITSAQTFYDLWASDALAEANHPSYKAPDGELFRVAEIHATGHVIADSGRTFTAAEFNSCARVEG